MVPWEDQGEKSCRQKKLILGDKGVDGSIIYMGKAKHNNNLPFLAHHLPVNLNQSDNLTEPLVGLGLGGSEMDAKGLLSKQPTNHSSNIMKK